MFSDKNTISELNQNCSFIQNEVTFFVNKTVQSNFLKAFCKFNVATELCVIRKMFAIWEEYQNMQTAACMYVLNVTHLGSDLIAALTGLNVDDFPHDFSWFKLSIRGAS